MVFATLPSRTACTATPASGDPSEPIAVPWAKIVTGRGPARASLPSRTVKLTSSFVTIGESGRNVAV